MDPMLNTYKNVLIRAVVSAAGVLTLTVVITGTAFIPKWIALPGVATPADVIYRALLYLAAVMSTVISLAIVWIGTLKRITAVFAVFLALTAVAAALEDPFIRTVWFLERHLGTDSVWLVYWWPFVWGAASAFGLAAAIRWTQLFPVPVQASHIHKHIRHRPIADVAVALLRPSFLWWNVALILFIIMYAMKGGQLNGSRPLVDPGTISTAAVCLTFVFCYINVTTNYEFVTDDERARMNWILQAAVIGGYLAVAAVGFEFAVHVLRLHSQFVMWGHAIALPLGIVCTVTLLAIGVFYAGSIDTHLAIRRTAVYGLVGLMLTAAFIAIEGALSSFFVQTRATAGASMVLTGSAASLALGPVRTAVEARINAFITRILPPTALAAGERRNTVVVFTDLVGYTALSHNDESTAITLVSLFHATGRRVCDRHGGRLVKSVGDAVMLEFSDETSAFESVRDLKNRYMAAAHAIDLNPLDLRTGIHAGTVTVGRDGDLFGDTVNVASRLASAAAPNQVVFSKHTAERLRNDPPLIEVTQSLKGIKKPVISYVTPL
jgi:class 3 adenylate cyclase